MPPDPKSRPSLDGVHHLPGKRQPDYRPDHELPAPEPTLLLQTPPAITPEDAEVAGALDPIDEPPRRRSWRKWLLIGLLTVVLAAAAVAASSYLWYQQQLAPASTDTTKHIRLTIASGATPDAIADQLKSAGVIRSKLAFSIYTKLTNTENILKAGAYSLQPSLSTPAIVDHLTSGKQDTFRLTFLPGDTLANNRQKIIEVGYSAAEVDAALRATYDRSLFASKPAGTDLEGYIFGETYEFDASATPASILNRTFDEFEAFIAENDLVNGFKKQDLSLYEGITLSSIVQREVSVPADQRQIARVFLNRMKVGMTLGSDVTYQYAAKKLGVAPTPTLESPYNTRIHTGLPPGPIAVPGVNAMKAVANPAANDYLFFLSGDNNVTYFAKTDAEHQQNIVNHCQKKCLIN